MGQWKLYWPTKIRHASAGEKHQNIQNDYWIIDIILYTVVTQTAEKGIVVKALRKKLISTENLQIQKYHLDISFQVFPKVT